MREALNRIGADRVEHPEGIWADSTDPANGEVIGRYAPGNAELVDRAVAVANDAFETSSWTQAPRLREEVLRRFADRLAAQSDAITGLLCRENGKLRHEARGELLAAISEARFYAGLARVPQGRSGEVVPGSLSILAREPAGVAAVIVPWNAPVTLLVRSLAPALAAGCTVIVKPAPQTSLVNAAVMDLLLDDPDLPPGTVNVINESGIEVGRALVASPGVQVISFTGASATGKAIMVAAAPTMKRLSLELGGKSPGIVFPDADLDRAVRELAFGALSVAGQFCMCASRLLVHADIYDDFRARMAERFASIKVGPAADPSSEMGPLIDANNELRLRKLIDAASDQGEVIVRGARPEDVPPKGAFLTPTLVGINNLRSTFVQEELFGPIITLERFTSEAEARDMAHATPYGLAASIHTQNIEVAHRLARRLRFGTVWINCHRRQFAEAEVGGFGESGLGRLHGVEGLADFLETKHTFLEYSPGGAA
ncbi:aldehyde dehydrogenase family protein [Alkalilacustris brevis]|uniref:aldehyde dehydrogenase family protein n=1 Tax=Alkalilacustris brevis TaxID=2026338 RepID=UPI000E0D4240|nr:aldehyde dehydrogenase family protein [Alkalilacustris brevis]